MPQVPIFFETRLVGVMDIDENGPGFIYDPIWIDTRGAFPISTLMPFGNDKIASNVFAPWASNLLPESDQLRAVSQFLGASMTDVVGILKAIGRDTAGALSIGQPSTASTKGWKRIGDAADLERILNELPKKPFLIGEDGVSMSLAGVQSKLAVAIDRDGFVCIPTDGAPSTHILKPDSDRLWGSVQNEAFCLTLAKLLKLPVPAVSTGIAGARSYLLVERYDRAEQQGRWRRIHQEDFCQALGKPPSAKYETNDTGVRGPALKDMFDLTRSKLGARDLVSLLDMLIFNIIACNTDAHAKNYSILIKARGAALAPIYDVMCATVWENVTRNLAQKVAGKDRGEHLKGRHWQRFARECGLNPRQVLNRVKALASAADEQAAAAQSEVESMPGGGHALLPSVTISVQSRAKAMLSGLSEIDNAWRAIAKS
jgi:serine/threonine-protein kinase HipA